MCEKIMDFLHHLLILPTADKPEQEEAVPVYFFRSFSHILGFQTGLTFECLSFVWFSVLLLLSLLSVVERLVTFTPCISREVNQISPWFSTARHLRAGRGCP